MEFEDLEVWKRAARLSANIYKELARWIKEVKEISSMLGGLIKTKKKIIQAQSQK